jgi:SAM-dependent methyltransferase
MKRYGNVHTLGAPTATLGRCGSRYVAQWKVEQDSARSCLEDARRASTTDALIGLLDDPGPMRPRTASIRCTCEAMTRGNDFDRYAGSYEALHAENVAPSGEPPSYFAEYKKGVLERILGRRFERPLLDFGCGIGTLVALLGQSFREVHGYDPSRESLKVARARAPAVRFFEEAAQIPRDHYGGVVLANVLHHLAPAERPGLLATAASLLGPQGRLIVFEHNPLNPITRRVVAACPFDDGAQLLHPRQLKGLCRGAGLYDVRLDFIVFFPKALRLARPLEPKLAWLPLGAQMCAWGIRQ